MKKLIFLIAFSSASFLTFATDTSLTNQRIIQIKQLADVLSEKSEDAWSEIRSDSARREKFYRSIIDSFCKARTLDLSISLRSPFVSLDNMLMMVGKEKMILRPPNSITDTQIIVKNYPA